ncbi:MAG TPA: tetratricopeptide repeat protein [Candidatus Limnocylindrales bacterium]|nr:tetratricopeptide repeat protein [Candidatus Limnocylindrales bacterium]
MATDSSWVRLQSWLPISALLLVATLAFRRLDDFDTWWHLAAGRWIARNGTVMSKDTLSFTVPDNEWVNLQWLYDLLLYAVYGAGGATALVLASVACFVATFVLLQRHVQRLIGPVLATLLLAWVATTVNERFLIRPEMATFPLLAAVQLVLTAGRERPATLRWLVPIMLAWTNLHSLFILGVAAMLCAIGGALVAEVPLLPRGWRRDSAWPREARKELLIWGSASLAATLINPYFFRALTFPFELMTRIDGSADVYQIIGEFRRPFSGYFLTYAIGSYQVMFFAGLVLAVLAGLVRAFAPSRRGEEQGGGRFDLGWLVFFLALSYLSLLARRNIGVFAVGVAPFLASCLAILISRMPRRYSRPDTMVAKAATAVVPAAMLALSLFVATNGWYARTGETHEFGPGVFDANFPVRAVEFFRAHALPGPTYCDLTAGGYLAWDDPSGRGVYVDGRLEVYDTPFLQHYFRTLSDGRAWLADAEQRQIQSVFLFHRWGNRQALIRFLLGVPAWRLVYYDEVAAIFVRAAGNEGVVAKARESFVADWRPRTDALLFGPTRTASWQWPVERYTALVAYARLREAMGDPSSAAPYFEKALTHRIPREYELEILQRLAQFRAQRGETAQARALLERARALAPADENVRAMLAQLGGSGS